MLSSRKKSGVVDGEVSFKLNDRDFIVGCINLCTFFVKINEKNSLVVML